MHPALTDPAADRIFGPSWAASGAARLGARAIDSCIALFLAIVTMLAGPDGRPFAQGLLILAVVTTWEALFLVARGATPGMAAVGIEVRSLDGPADLTFLQAIRRTVPVALCYTLPFPGTITVITMPIVLGISMGLSPFRRAFHERTSLTITVRRGAPDVVTPDDVDLWWDPAELPVVTSWGRVPDLHERRRARAHRLDGQWWLAAVVATGALATAATASSRAALLGATAIWLVVFIGDETWHVAREASTPGHRAYGFRVVDHRSGEPPSTTRAFLRAVVLAPLLYIPPLQLLLGFWVKMSKTHRGPHDLAGGTIVVEPDFEAPALPAWQTPQHVWIPPAGWIPPTVWAPPPPPHPTAIPGWAPVPPHPVWTPPPPRHVPPPPPPPTRNPPDPTAPTSRGAF